MSDKVGKKIGKKTQAGKDVYETPEGKNVSEISSTFEYKGKWINVPSVHKGYEYDDATLRLMLEAGVIKPTSVHDSRTEAEAEADARSDRLKFDKGGMATEEERLEFVKSYGVEPVTDINTDLTFKDAGTAVAEMTPIIGDAMAAKEIYDELQKEDPDYRFIAVLGGAALVGAVPGIGDVAAKGIRNAADMIKRIEVDPDALGMMGGNIRIRPKEIKPFELDEMYRDDFDWNRLDLTDYQVDAIADAQKSYLISGGGAKAVEAAEKRVQDAIDARIPAITEALKFKLKTSDKGVVSLDDYKDAVEATVRFDTVEEAAESISDQRAILNKMGPSMMDDMLYDDKISGAFEKLPNTETFKYILDNGLDRDLAEWAVAEDAIRKSYNKYKKAANTPKPPRATKGDVDFDAKMAALDEAEDATTWQQNAKKVVKERGIDLDDKKSLEALELQKSTRLLLENKITREEHLFNVDRLKPVGEYDKLPREPSDKALVFALDSGKREKGLFVLNDKAASKLSANVSTLKVGDQFNSRLDIPAYLSHDTWIVAGTSPAVKTADGKGVTSYAKAVHFGGDDKPVRFIASQKQSEKIGTGVDNKTGYATVSGTVKDLDADAIRAKAAELLDDPEWTQVGFDPRRQGGFYVRTGVNKHVPVREATEVIQIGPLVLAKNAKLDIMYQGYSEGGMAIEEQMAMNFGDVPDNTIGIDPVSGNEIPMGSTAENVRDDIPANLSEGEIVVPADVVNFHGVKLFEDLRAEAKMGYQEMAQDGRMGGEPMDDMGMDIELSELDLEVMDDEAPVQMNRGGTSMADYKDVAKNRNIKAPKRTAPRKTHAEIMAQAFGSNTDSRKDNSPEAISARVQARKNDPKTRGEALLKRLNNIVFGDDDDDDRRVKLYEKPRTSDDIGPSIANKINFGGQGFDFRNNQSPTPPPPKVRQSTRGAKGVPDDVETFSVRYPELSFYESLIKNFKRDLGFDEGGLATDEDTNLIGGEAQFNQPFYAPDQKGGFDMENAYTNYGDGTGGGPLLEMREYMNDDGHRIFITFIDGVAQMEIPPGYYPVEGEGVAVAPTPAVGGSGGSDMGDDGNAGGIPPELMPTPINYKELTMEELTQMVEDQKNMKGDVIAGGISYLSPIVGGAIKVAMWNTTRQTKAEIIRRRDDPYTSEVDKRRYDSLLEISEREEPGLIATLFGKLTGNDPSAPAVRTPQQTDALYAQLDKMTQAYTPDVQTASNRTTPGVDDDFDYKAAGAKASKEAADIAFKDNPLYGQDKQSTTQVALDNQSAADDAMGRPISSDNNNNDSPIVRPPTPVAKPSPIYDNVAAGDYDDDSTGVYKGGMMRKKKKKKSK